MNHPVNDAVLFVEDLSHLRVLVADDNSFNQFIFKKIVSKWNVNPVFADNGLEAIERFESAEFDIVFIDLQMPILDGVEATRKIRQMNATVPIIALSAAVIEDEVQRAIEAGVQDFVLKPFEPDSVYSFLIKLSTAKGN